ncbi:8413_t:CDS:2, partial [Cetraspora pellucida]
SIFEKTKIETIDIITSKITEQDTASNIFFEIIKTEEANSASQVSETAIECCNHLAREYYARKIAYLATETTESACGKVFLLQFALMPLSLLALLVEDNAHKCDF